MPPDSTRRRYLAAVAGILAGCTTGGRTDGNDGGRRSRATTANTPAGRSVRTEAADRPTVGGRPFDRVVDMVEDAGCDPTGTDPCDERFEAVLDTGVLLSFPPGRYRFERPHGLEGEGRVGMVGEGDVRFVFPPGFSRYAFVLNTTEALFSGIDVDVTNEGTVVGIKLRVVEALRIEDVRQIGRGTSPDPEVPHFLIAEVNDPEGLGLLRNVVATEGSAIGQYKDGDGRGGVFVGQYHRGTIRIVDCHFEEFGNNGLYCSRTPGDIEVLGGVYRNNNAANVRVSGDGSYVENATVEVDMDDYDGPRGGLDGGFNPRGIVIEQGPLITRPKPAGAEVRNCDVAILAAPPRTQGGVNVSHTGRGVTVTDTRIRVDADRVPAVYAVPLVEDGPHPPASPPRPVRLRNVVVRGSSSTGEACRLVDAVGSTFRDCRIDQRAPGRDAVVLIRSGDSLVDGTSVRASRYPVVIDDRESTSSGGCLVRVRDGVQIRSTALQYPPDAVRTLDLVSVDGGSTTTDTGTRTRDLGERCLPPKSLPTRGKRVGLIGVDPGTVRGLVLE